MNNKFRITRLVVAGVVVGMTLGLMITSAGAMGERGRGELGPNEREALEKEFSWWPTDAQPAPVPDEDRGGYWWWPVEPGEARPWGNRGYVYVRKVIFDYQEEELPPAKPQEMRPSLLIKKIIRNVKIYFDFDKSDIRSDAVPILEDAVRSLERNPQADILITGNADVRGSEKYNERLGRARADTVMQFMNNRGIAENRVRIISRGKLDAVAPISDLVGMQRDRNAQFMVAEVEEVMLPAPDVEAKEEAGLVEQLGEGRYIMEQEEKVESAVQVSTTEYTVQKGDTLSGIAKKYLGSGHRWKYLFELNKDRIKDPNKLREGTKLIIPIE